MKFEIKQREIKRRTYAILFGVLPLFLFILGFYLAIITNAGWLSSVYYLPLWINIIISLFFKSEKYVSLLDKIPEKVKLAFFVVMLICILGIAPIIGVFSIITIDYSRIPFGFALREDVTQLLFGGLFIGCSCVFWIITLHALDIFRSIRHYVSRYSLLAIGVLLSMLLFMRWSDTGDVFYLIVGFLALSLCVGVTTRRCAYG